MKTQRDLIQQGKRTFRMSWDKVAELRQQHPWIDKYAKLPRQIYVSGFGPEILEYNLADEHEFNKGIFTWEFSSDTEERMWFLDKDGNIVVNETTFTYKVSVKKFLFFGPKRIVERKDVTRNEGKMSADSYSNIEGHFRFLDEKTASIRYILSYFQYTDAAIIYRVPNDKNFQDIVPYVGPETRARRMLATLIG